MNVEIYLQGWRNSRLLTDAVNQNNHVLHADALAVTSLMFRKYEPWSTVFLAVCYDDEGTDREICSRAFDRFNIGEPAHDEAVAKYRGAGCRSLSVGDVVVVDGRAYACASLGWDLIDEFEPNLAER